MDADFTIHGVFLSLVKISSFLLLRRSDYLLDAFP